jgi:hypothetical protein
MSAPPTSPPATLLVILDVDGVTRLDVFSDADPLVIAAVTRILALADAFPQQLGPVRASAAADAPLVPRLRFVFLSGSHSGRVAIPASPLKLAAQWRAPNRPLCEVFHRCFPRRFFNDTSVSIIGQLGCDAALPDTDEGTDSDALVRLSGSVERGFEPAVRVELLRVALTAYGDFLASTGNLTAAEHGRFAELVADAAARCRTGASEVPADHTPDAFEAAAGFLRAEVDPTLRLISHAGNAEVGGCPARRAVNLRVESLVVLDHFRSQLRAHADPAIAALGDRVAAGVAHMNGVEFIWACITLSNKGIAVRSLLERSYAARGLAPPAMITVGDSQVDYSMHTLALPPLGAAFHVGPPSTWQRMRDEHPGGEHAHVVFVPLAACAEARAVASAAAAAAATTTATEPPVHDGAPRTPPPELVDAAKLHGTKDTMALTTGTLEVLVRLEAGLRAAAMASAASGVPVSFESVVAQCAGSFRRA